MAVGSIRRAEWLRVTLPLPHGPGAPVRLMHLSDLHIRRAAHPVLETLIAKLSSEAYDAVLVTGDFVDDKFDARAQMPIVADMVARLRSRWGTYAILGNHDGDLARAWLAGMAVRMIDGQRLRIGEVGREVDLVGLPGVRREAASEHFDFNRDPAVPTIALSHYPDAIHRLGRLKPDLVLAGHTHGGQICLPGRVPLITHDSLPRHMCAGVHVTPNGCLVVSRGIGHTDIPVRLFSPPQVIEIVLCGEGGRG